MNEWRLCGAALLLWAVTGCALQQSGDYDQWRDFHSAVNTMSAVERRERSAELSMRNDRAPSTLTRLQLAYLMTSGSLAASGEIDYARVTGLLDSVPDDHELAPIRDMLRQYLQLSRRYDQHDRAVTDLRRECSTLNTQLEAASDERAALQRDVDTCNDQLRALKEIESMMSAPDGSAELQP